MDGWRGGPLLLIHGVGLRAEAWAPMLPHLTAQFRVTALDLPGHGHSAALPDKATLADFTDSIAEVLNAPTYVVGHSMGALIAMDMAARHPEHVAAIAPLNAIFRRSVTARAAVQQRAADIAGGSQPDPSATLDRWFGPQPTGPLQSARDNCADWLTSVDPRGYATAYRVFAEEDGPADTDLARITCPALFVTGADEPNSTPAMSQALAAHVPNGQATILTEARHMMPMTHAQDVAALLCAFFQRHSHATA
ncbi:alpha/beta fold hydrolase [Tateyamaria sp. SN3-11]|uniref:alpha/beta fold hydrolase n=1 Tax=Tateyamaria sp. SN3-11 TaxID=3092147 RepID=UPI0039E831AA